MKWKVLKILRDLWKIKILQLIRNALKNQVSHLYRIKDKKKKCIKHKLMQSVKTRSLINHMRIQINFKA